jgi:hypothetical protein
MKLQEKFVKLFLILVFLSGLLFAESGKDTFGIAKFYPTKQGTREWNSLHWNNGKPRTFKYAPDPDDPTGWTEDHSSSTDGFRVDGAGMMEMSGGGPRFHVNSLLSSKVTAQKFRNIEFTAYYQRKGASGQNYAGMVIGLRSGPIGHGSPGGNDCDATTYYGRFRNDGKWDFEKELKHPQSSYWSGSGFNKQDPLWKGANLPLKRWIGMKYLCYNIQNNTKVKLELYIDSVSNGKPNNGGYWEKVGEVVDEGNWPAGDVSGCDYQNTRIILDGGGTMLMRTDNDTADYTMVSIREIVVADTRVVTAPLFFNRPAIRFSLFDMQGRLRSSGKISPFSPRTTIPSGFYLLQIREGATNRIMKIAVP